MFIDRNTTYSDAGSILVAKKSEKVIQVSYSCTVPENDDIEIVEETINLNKIEALPSRILQYWSEGGIPIVQLNYPERTYAEWKSAIIKWRYSNDDQIAILLNKDDSSEDTERFDRMQQWREWAAKLAKRIMDINDGDKQDASQ